MRMLAGIAMAAIAGCAWAGPKVPICMDLGPDGPTLIVAERLASKMFAGIGVEAEWGEWPKHRDSCLRNGAILITLSYQTPSSNHPGAWGYALPFEGEHIVVFWDRVQHKVSPVQAPFLLAHVLVHEITHILQGVDWHSETGVMKAAWDADEIREMMRRPLGFTELDVNLIRRGLEARSLVALNLAK